MYFKFNPDIIFLNGGKQHICHSLLDGKVYFFNDKYKDIIESIYRTNNIDELKNIYGNILVDEVINFLLQRKLGKVYSNNKVQVDTVRISNWLENQSRLKQFRLNTVMLELTNRCNYDCVFCIKGNVAHTSCGCCRYGDNILVLKDYKKIIEQLSKLGVKNIQFIGGEPLIEESILIEIINYSYQHNIKSIIYTNASLLNEKNIDLFSKYKSELIIQLFSMNIDIMDCITRVKNSYTNLNKKLDLIKKSDVHYNYVYLINSLNLNENPTLFTPFYLNKINLIKKYVFPPNPYSIFKSCEDINLIQSNLKVNINNYEILQDYNPCWYSFSFIDSRGDMYPCIGLRYSSYKLSNVYTQPIYKQYRSDEYKKYWEYNNFEDKMCNNCSKRLMCINCKAYAIVNRKENIVCKSSI